MYTINGIEIPYQLAEMLLINAAIPTCNDRNCDAHEGCQYSIDVAYINVDEIIIYNHGVRYKLGVRELK